METTEMTTNNESVNPTQESIKMKPAIGEDELRKALETYNKYKSGKANLDKNIISNEEWYKMRHWTLLRQGQRDRGGDVIEPTSGWLLNVIMNKHASAMDSFPSPNIVPREEGDKSEAKMLSSILPVLLDQCGFEETYDREQYYKLKHGTGCYGVFWDASADNGLGAICIKHVDILNLMWQNGVSDIQESPNVFYAQLVENEQLEMAYPQLKGKLGANNITKGSYIYSDAPDETTKSMVIDWYYKKVENGKTVLHYCKFCNLEVLYSTENMQNQTLGETLLGGSKGLYDHGMYPFIFDVLFPLEGTPVGFGYIDIGKSSQEYLDRCGSAMMDNLMENATPRYFSSESAGINEEEFNDRTKRLVHYVGNPQNIFPAQTAGLAPVYHQIYQAKIDEMKETSGNRDVQNGGSTGGATAASAIAAMQEAGSRLDRDSGKGSYRAFRKIIVMMIELIRQFYTTTHYFRIVGEGGTENFVRYTNEHLAPQYGIDITGQMTVRLPLFDVEITAEKKSPYSRMAQNEMALQFYNAGFFAPNNADSALVCLDMMDFDRKDEIMQKISMNQTLFMQLQAMSQEAYSLARQVDSQNGTNYSEQVAQQMRGIGMQVQSTGNAGTAESTEALGGEADESGVTKKAREETAERVNPA